MNGDETDREHNDYAASEPARSLPPDPVDGEKDSDWKKRKTVLRQVFQISPTVGNIQKRRWDPNLWRLDSRRLLSILRAEAFRERTNKQLPP